GSPPEPSESDRLASSHAKYLSRHCDFSVEAQPVFGVGIERAPQQTVECGYQERHDDDTEDYLRIIADGCVLRDVGTETVRRDFGITPRNRLGDDTGVPRTARCGDRAGDKIRKYPR